MSFMLVCVVRRFQLPRLVYTDIVHIGHLYKLQRLLRDYIFGLLLGNH